MRWETLTVEAEMGIQEGLPCSVCGRFETDLVYFPVNINERQAKWIETIWGCHPCENFLVCEGCMEGHCGSVLGLNADNWLEAKIKGFKAANEK